MMHTYRVLYEAIHFGDWLLGSTGERSSVDLLGSGMPTVFRVIGTLHN
jgi:hypothetical protein